MNYNSPCVPELSSIGKPSADQILDSTGDETDIGSALHNVNVGNI